MDKVTGREQKHEIADKQVMTVLIAIATKEQPVAECQWRLPVLEEDPASELTQLGAEIGEMYQMPMDVEWAIFNGKYAILQARPITDLPKPEPDPPTEWKLPKGNYTSLRNNIVELMADPLTPLFGSLGLAAVVTDVGGPLCHGSIVAQEYGIPAVLGTGQATRTIQSGQNITVDGNEGAVYLSVGMSVLKEK